MGAPLTEGPRTDAEAAAIQALVEAGYTIEPPNLDAWVPAFKPHFYEAGGDQDGAVYCRVDLPEGLYYAFQDAARLGLNTLRARWEVIQKVEREVADLERNAVSGKQRTIGLLDGVELTSMELRSLLSGISDQIKRFEQALERADTRRNR